MITPFDVAPYKSPLLFLGVAGVVVPLFRRLHISPVLGFLIAGPAGDKVLPGNTTIGIVLLWAAAGLTIYTGWDYFNAGIRHLVEQDERMP